MTQRYTVNQQLRFEEQNDVLNVVYPDGFRAKIPRQQMSLIRSFASPVELSAVAPPPGLNHAQFDSLLAQLLDLIIIVPAGMPQEAQRLPLDLLIDEDDTFRAILREVRGYTMGTPALCYALYQAVRHVATAGIEGAIVESGVWRGGHIALCARTLLAAGDDSRDLYLFDTFDWSWPKLTQFDTKHGQGTPDDRNAVIEHSSRSRRDQLDAELVTEERVTEYLQATGYPAERIFTVKGLVQDTMPDAAPEKIALLRLDTDLYESTYHELVHLYPRLVSGGILLIDDYPTEGGCVRAVEQYFGEVGARPFLVRIDTQGRIGVKP